MSTLACLADERYDCEKLRGEASLKACSAVIEAGTYDARTLAIAYLNRGLEYFDKGYYDQAINDYSGSIDLDRRNADVYNNRGTAYQAKQDFDRAISDFDTAISLSASLKTMPPGPSSPASMPMMRKTAARGTEARGDKARGDTDESEHRQKQESEIDEARFAPSASHSRG